MKRTLAIALAAVLLAACTESGERLRGRAEELCRYIPDHGLEKGAENHMTAEFYAVLDTMFNRLPEHEAMDHEWLYYFVTGNGGTMADCTVSAVELVDRTHAVATVAVRQQWEDGSIDTAADVEVHRLYMEKAGGVWLMSDFDEHKADCKRHIAESRREEAVRDAIGSYLADEVGRHYRRGEVCVPALMMVHEDADVCEGGGIFTRVWGDFQVFWYDVSGDTLKCVSGGSHSGLATLCREDGRYRVAAFEQTEDGAGYEASARRIFGPHYDMFCSMHGNGAVREAVRREQLREYAGKHGLDVRYYQDYGWPAVELGL